jgi:hypothetical protein
LPLNIRPAPRIDPLKERIEVDSVLTIESYLLRHFLNVIFSKRQSVRSPRHTKTV